jgi:spermidine synthase
MNRWNNKTVALFISGVAALTAQVVLLRELIALFGGNELIYGLILTVWLLTYAVGSILGGKLADRISSHLSAFVLTQSILLFLLPAMIFTIRGSRELFGLPFGVLPALPAILQVTAVAIFPVTLILGLQFSLGSVLLEQKTRGIGSAYILESAGAFTGGLILSLVLLHFFNSCQIAALSALLLALSVIALTGRKRTLFLLVFALLLLGAANYLERTANDLAWHGYGLVKTADSPFGKLALTRSGEQFNYYLDGGLLCSTADLPLAEEFIHLTMIQHRDPADVLLIGGGLGGAVGEALKYPVKNLDYVELDPKLIKLRQVDFPANVKFQASDGVRYIKTTKKKYDLVIINLPDPQSALLNRYYTREFYQSAGQILQPGGIVAFKLSGSADFMSTETRQLNATVFKAAAQAFPAVTVFPGNYLYFFASGRPTTPDPAKLQSARYFNLPALKLDLSREKTNYVKKAIGFDERTRLNTELQPISYYQAILLWASYFNPAVKYFLYSLLQINLLHILAALALLFGLIELFLKPLRLPATVSALGFAGMTAQLIVILVFQSEFGYLYQAIALLSAAFMAGLAAGGYLTNNYFDRLGAPKRLMGTVFIVFAVLLLLFIACVSYLTLPVWLFPLFSLLFGSLVGLYFPLAVRAGETPGRGVGGLAGLLYGADLFGGALAAVLATIFFIPVLGIVLTALIVLSALALAFLLVKDLG